MELKDGRKFTHKDLVEIAYRWVLKNGSCGVAFKELDAHGSSEIPDVIGFGGWDHSVLIEVKVSRSDFLSDKNKSFRKSPSEGMGSQRMYCCPTGLISKEELPLGWGLLYVSPDGKCKAVHRPMVEYPSEHTTGTYKRYYRHDKNTTAELGIMYSALRRLFIKGLVKHIYDRKYTRGVTANDVIEANEIVESGLTIDKTKQ